MRNLPRFAVVMAAALLVAGTGAPAAWAQAPWKVGEVRPYLAETPHPYPAGAKDRPVVWADRVVSPGATFIRVHLSGLSLARGDYLTISDPDRTRVQTYMGEGPHRNGDLWSFSIDGDTALVEIHAAGREIGHGYRIDAVGHGTARIEPAPEVVCGSNGLEDVACHTKDKAFAAAQRPVARLLFASGGFLFLCTGWLADGANASTLVTNNHCISKQSEADSLEALFNFQVTKCGGTTPAPTMAYAGGTILKTNNIQTRGKKDGLDYTLLALDGNPELTWGKIVPSRRPLAVGDPIWFIQHPGGEPKQVGFWEDAEQTVRCQIDAVDQSLRGVAHGSQAFYACDSAGGSSGSPIIDPATGHAIALHHFGGVATNPCLNGATEMAPICDDAGPLLNCAAD
ncbi:MAG: serine protease [Acidobacteria bacterium]|nr:MAG: serine protease [Acidobacteriota bacterium]